MNGWALGDVPDWLRPDLQDAADEILQRVQERLAYDTALRQDLTGRTTNIARASLAALQPEIDAQVARAMNAAVARARQELPTLAAQITLPTRYKVALALGGVALGVAVVFSILAWANTRRRRT